MKKFALAMSVSVLALATPAMAKDGFYMGLGLGYNQNEHSVAHTMTAGTLLPANLALVNAAPTDDISTDVYGAQIFFGYKHQLANMLSAAIELDAAAFDGETEDFHTQNYTPALTGAFTLRQRFSQQWMSTLRAKQGLNVTSDLAVFVTGGMAIADVELRTSFSDTNPVVLSQIPIQHGETSDIKTGFVYGGGIDWALGGSTSLRVEYLKADLGNVTTTRALNLSGGGPSGHILSSKADLETTSIRVGLAWDLNL